jgi:multiple sugar transport system substrate-binding protein
MARMGVRRRLPAAPRLGPTVLALLLAALTAAGCGGSGGSGPPHDSVDSREPGRQATTVWLLEDQPARVRATKADLEKFTKRTGITINLQAVGEDDLSGAVTTAAQAGTLPDAIQLPLASVHAYAASGLLDTVAAEDVIARLGDQTFSQTALSLVSRDGRPGAVPSDGWGELLIYRKDLFEQAGLPAPTTLAAIRTAARRLNQPGTRAGITLATAPGEAFTAQTFEHLALAAGCQVVDDRSRIRLTSAPCRRAFDLYVELARRYSPGGYQDVETTRKTYFAGKAAMIFWSPFLLDAMAGLRDDARPTCPQCKRDPAYLARNSGLVGALSSGAPGAPAVQFGELSSWGIVAGGNADAAGRFVEYMLSDGYVSQLSISPQGKYPVRPGDAADPERYATAWARLNSGVERKAPLRRFYGQASIDRLGDGVRSFQRWGFQQGEAPLIGALRNQEPITRPLALAITGTIDPLAAARQAQLEVEAVRARTR